jgi:tRNA threonylcarbamoyladenosine biosynthesis protein TsaB
MKILAIDTATERCSVALLIDGHCVERSIDTARGHAEIVLPMIDEVLREGAVRLGELDALAFGRGPGAFTGVRIAAGVVQGLALGSGLPVAAISDLAAIALEHTAAGECALTAIDARMGEVYWAVYERTGLDQLVLIDPEQVGAPESVRSDGDVSVCAGSGVKAYPDIAGHWPGARVVADALPRARAIAALGAAAVRRGETCSAAQALPVYLRDEVVQRPPT